MADGSVTTLPQSEKELQRAVVELARYNGWTTFHFPSVLTWSERGWPDLVLVRVRDRRLIFAELKSEKGKLSERQAEVLEVLRSVAFDGQGLYDDPTIGVHTWRPSDWSTIERELR
jgi:hypothetical protein